MFPKISFSWLWLIARGIVNANWSVQRAIASSCHPWVKNCTKEMSIAKKKKQEKQRNEKKKKKKRIIKTKICRYANEGMNEWTAEPNACLIEWMCIENIKCTKEKRGDSFAFSPITLEFTYSYSYLPADSAANSQ